MDKKRANYTANEKELLVELVAKYSKIVENKKSNGVANSDKEACWKNEICTEFNSQCLNVYRAADSLRKQWANMKHDLRKKAADTKKDLNQTGGGRNSVPNLRELDLKILGLVDKDSVFGVNHNFDGDGQTDNAVESEESNEVPTIDIIDTFQLPTELVQDTLIELIPIPSHNETPVPSHNETPVPSHSKTPVPSHSKTPVPSHSKTPVSARRRPAKPVDIAKADMAIMLKNDLLDEINHKKRMREQESEEVKCELAHKAYIRQQEKENLVAEMQHKKKIRDIELQTAQTKAEYIKLKLQEIKEQII